jgi:hypothetical protein
MPDGGVSDAQIAAMSATERRELISRLERPLGELLPESELVRVRRVRLVLMVGAIVGLIPWAIYLANTLPDKYIAHNWPVTWGGIRHPAARVHGRHSGARPAAPPVAGSRRVHHRRPAGLRRVVRRDDGRADRHVAVGVDGRLG